MKTIAKCIVVMLLACTGNAFACTCMPMVTVQEEIKRSDFVFKGTVKTKNKFIHITHLPDNGFTFLSDVEYVFEVETVFKGRRITKTIEVMTGYGGGDCGYIFEVGKSYIVYSSIVTPPRLSFNLFPPYLITSICTRTRPYEVSEIEGIEKYTKKQK